MTDGGFDLSSVLSSQGGMSDAISNAMSALMKRPDLISSIASELGLSGGTEEVPSDPEPNKESESAPASADEERKEAQQFKPSAHSHSDKDRLLLALRPYLSPARQEAIDMMINLGSISSLLGNINPELLRSLLGGIGVKNTKNES